MMGQPIKGDRDILHTLRADHLRDFHSTNFFGDNIVVVGAGNISHDELVSQVNQHFSSLPKQTSSKIKNKERAVFNPALLFIRDDEMVNSNVAVFYDAPSIRDPDYYSFLLLKNMFGTYRIDKNAEHLNDVKKQYNSMHALLGDLPDVTRQESLYYAYSDSGIWGNYFYGNEVFTRQMNYCGVCLPTIYSHFLNDVEVYRGRNALYNKLLNRESPNEIVREIGRQILYLNRRVPRSEIAKRVAHVDGYHLKHLCN
jgi:mitochondrial-processing peptidase subunit beta